jgi:hypothetical protein
MNERNETIQNARNSIKELCYLLSSPRFDCSKVHLHCAVVITELMLLWLASSAPPLNTFAHCRLLFSIHSTPTQSRFNAPVSETQSLILRSLHTRAQRRANRYHNRAPTLTRARYERMAYWPEDPNRQTHAYACGNAPAPGLYANGPPAPTQGGPTWSGNTQYPPPQAPYSGPSQAPLTPYNQGGPTWSGNNQYVPLQATNYGPLQAPYSGPPQTSYPSGPPQAPYFGPSQASQPGPPQALPTPHYTGEYNSSPYDQYGSYDRVHDRGPQDQNGAGSLSNEQVVPPHYAQSGRVDQYSPRVLPHTGSFGHKLQQQNHNGSHSPHGSVTNGQHGGAHPPARNEQSSSASADNGRDSRPRLGHRHRALQRGQYGNVRPHARSSAILPSDNSSSDGSSTVSVRRDGRSPGVYQPHRTRAASHPNHNLVVHREDETRLPNHNVGIRHEGGTQRHTPSTGINTGDTDPRGRSSSSRRTDDGPGIRQIDGTASSPGLAYVARVDSLLDQMRADRSGRKTSLRHYINELSTLRNEGVTVSNQSHASTAQAAGNNVVERAHQPNEQVLAERRAAARDETGTLMQ